MKPTDNKKDVGGRACKPDSVERAIRRDERHTAAIIPLGHGSHRDSSSLPEGFRWAAAFAATNEAGLRKKTCSTSRAGSPLLFGLAPRGVFRASGVTTEAVGSYPTFSPLPGIARLASTSRRFSLRDCHGARCAGGLFSVALSVAKAAPRSGLTGTLHALRVQLCLAAEPAWPLPDVIRRVALS